MIISVDGEKAFGNIKETIKKKILYTLEMK